MKTTMAWIFGAIISIAGLPTYAGTEGHGGDSLRFMFEDARSYSVSKTMELKSCSLSPEVRPDIKEWILQNKLLLAGDVQDSRHVWLTDNQPTCAFTQTSAKADVSFSFVTCRSGIHSLFDAAKILVHESVHHFGIANEAFADEVATAIIGASNSSCGTNPVDNRIKSCEGNPLTESEAIALLSPGNEHRSFGLPRQQIEYRDCYISGCGPWTSSNNVDLAFDLPGTSYFRTVEVYLRLVNNRPNLGLRWQKSGSSWWGAVSPGPSDIYLDCGVVAKNQLLGCAVPELAVMHFWSGRWAFEPSPKVNFIGNLKAGCADVGGQYSVDLIDNRGNSLRREFRWNISATYL